MKQTDKKKSSLVAATLVIGTVFILSVVYQNWTVDDIIQEPVASMKKCQQRKMSHLKKLK